MTVFAIVVLTVWAVGIIAITIVACHDPSISTPFTADPVRACLAFALCTVFWPAACIYAGLNRAAARWQQ